jgi:hypothetical protein
VVDMDRYWNIKPVMIAREEKTDIGSKNFI